MSSGLVYLRPSRLAYVRQVGPYQQTINQAWERMFDWLSKNGLSEPNGRGYGLMRDCPKVVAPEQCRYDACVDLNPFFEERAIRELGAQTLPGGSYIRIRKVGSYDALHKELPSMHDCFQTPTGLRLDERRPLVTIYLDDPARFTSSDLRADICVPVSVRAARADDRAAA